MPGGTRLVHTMDTLRGTLVLAQRASGLAEAMRSPIVSELGRKAIKASPTVRSRIPGITAREPARSGSKGDKQASTRNSRGMVRSTVRVQAGDPGSRDAILV